eukprot:1664652-Rhodomonas_salina.1
MPDVSTGRHIGKYRRQVAKFVPAPRARSVPGIAQHARRQMPEFVPASYVRLVGRYLLSPLTLAPSAIAVQSAPGSTIPYVSTGYRTGSA